MVNMINDNDWKTFIHLDYASLRIEQTGLGNLCGFSAAQVAYLFLQSSQFNKGIVHLVGCKEAKTLLSSKNVVCIFLQ
jgi:hypothetical protein